MATTARRVNYTLLVAQCLYSYSALDVLHLYVLKIVEHIINRKETKEKINKLSQVVVIAVVVASSFTSATPRKWRAAKGFAFCSRVREHCAINSRT